jgi:hypothetical protein
LKVVWTAVMKVGGKVKKWAELTVFLRVATTAARSADVTAFPMDEKRAEMSVARKVYARVAAKADEKVALMVVAMAVG